MRVASPRSGVRGCEAGTDRSQDASHGQTRRCRLDRFRLRIAFRPDPRHARNRKHLLIDLAVTAVCGVICGCDGPTALHRRAKQRASWLARHLAPPNGVPSRDCIRRLLMVLGKACRGSRDGARSPRRPNPTKSPPSRNSRSRSTSPERSSLPPRSVFWRQSAVIQDPRSRRGRQVRWGSCRSSPRGDVG